MTPPTLAPSAPTTAPASMLEGTRSALPMDPTELLVAGTKFENSEDDHAEETGFAERVATVLVVTLPVVGVVASIVMLWGVAFNWAYLAIMAGMYLVSGLGITIGFHRYFTHKSFDTSKPFAALLGVAGSMAVEGSLLDWAATHRSHHQHSDGEGDPHSPHAFGGGFWGVLRGAWHSHVGWFLSNRPKLEKRYIVDLLKDPMIRRVDSLFPLWVLLGLAIPAILGGLLTMSWMGVLLGFLWGGLVRVFLVHHVTWSVNSVCHIWGSRPFRSHDHSRNNPIFGVLALGEGWHNNHHAFPASARHGLRWWQFDISYIIIKSLSYIGVTRNVRVPSAERISAKLAA